MPLYEFECQQCHVVFEELVRMGSTGEGLNCPTCGHEKVGKKMSTFYGRASSGNGSHHSVGGGCGGNCEGCDGNCSCHSH